MGAKSAIQWTDSTWNPIRGCSMAKGSETGGCLNCYAARRAVRNLPGSLSPTTGKPFAIMRDSGPRWTGKVELIDKALLLPFHWRQPRRIFVNSQSDLFHENLPFEAIDEVLTVAVSNPQHTYQILTKRGERMYEYFSSSIERSVYTADQPNIWFGVSIENQATADARIPWLLRSPVPTRFVSYEPALETVDLREYLKGKRRLAWVIVGGESGPGARPFNLRWAYWIALQCQKARVPVFIKQLGRRPGTPSCASFTCNHPDCDVSWLTLKDKQGGDPDEWPAALRVRQLPELRYPSIDFRPEPIA